MSTISRRSFFQGAALASSSARVVGANNVINVGIIGLGNRGFRDHLRTVLYFSSLRECRVTALCDVNQAARERAQAELSKIGEGKANDSSDMRKVFDDKSVDAVTIATPDHWHALATIWACRSGKDVYVEKPASHNILEGRRMIEAARQHKRMVQVGTQSRSTPHKIKAVQLLHEGVIGKVYLAKGLCFKRRKSIGTAPVEPVPPGIDWDMFLGPAPMRPFTQNRFKYNWHWFWDTGTGDIGNQGVHEMDICRWGLGGDMPKSTFSSGSKYIYRDDQETPNTQLANFDYGDGQIVFEVRGMLTGPEAGLPVRPGYTIGNLFLGSDGWMWLDERGFSVHKGEENAKVMEESGNERSSDTLHMRNFLQACRSRNYKDLTADIETGATSAALCHLANISYRVGRKLTWDDAGTKFVGDSQADALLTRDYRKPYTLG